MGLCGFVTLVGLCFEVYLFVFGEVVCIYLLKLLVGFVALMLMAWVGL